MENGISKIEDMDVEGKRVLVRVGMDVSVDNEGNILDDSRVISCMPTIQHLVDRKARVILMLHIGRPGGKRPAHLTTDRVAERLSRYMFRKIEKLDGIADGKVRERIGRMKPGEIVFLENLRFHPGEEKNDGKFVRDLASMADIYVNECFSVSHRNHASMVGVPQLIPGAGGFCLNKEVDEISRVLRNPERPFVAVIGGVKADKLNALKTLSGKADRILVGGGLAFIFMKLKGLETGKSKFDSEWLDPETTEFMKGILGSERIVLPKDFMVSRSPDDNGPARVVDAGSIPPDHMGLDIGPETISAYKDILSGAGTIVWAGPMGMFEKAPYERGTRELAEHISGLDAVSLVGGGDSASAADKFRVADRFTHVSTGGGAFLDFLAKGTLPAIDALRQSALKFKG